MDAFAKQGVSLVVTVDCGATSGETFAYAKTLGLDVVVFDHHQAPEAVPEAVAVVDPNRQDDLSGLGALCAAGVVYMGLVSLARALRGAGFFDSHPAPNLVAALDLVALATVADVVPLVGLNRAFVTQGLAVMRERRRPGLTALLDIAGAGGPPKPYHLGFLVGPRINAGGRIGDAALGAKLLGTRDEFKAREIAAELDRLNRARQEIEVDALAEAEAEALLSLGEADRAACVVVGGQTWPPGIVGLVAARLKERFERPAFAFALQGAEVVGSGRSIAGVDLGRAVRAAVESGLALKGGGHAMAAGVTIAREKLGDFRAFLESALGSTVARARVGPVLLIDAALNAGARHARSRQRLRGGRPVRFGQSGTGLRPALASPDRHISRRREPSAPAPRRARWPQDRGHRFSRRRQTAWRRAAPAERPKRASRRHAFDQPLWWTGNRANARAGCGGGALTPPQGNCVLPAASPH